MALNLDLYCVHLAHRTDRMAHIKRLRTQYPSVRIHIVDAIRDTNGHRGCVLSHKKVIMTAKERNSPYVIVIEDDCDFLLPEPELISALHTSIEYLQSHPHIEIVNGCGNLPTLSAKLLDTVGDMRFLTAPTVHTTHCMIYSERAYDKLLAISEHIPIDIQTNTLSMVFTYPYLATQIPSYSNISNQDIEYTNIAKSQAFVREILENARPPSQVVHKNINPMSVFRIPIRAYRM
jgi:GR25 family glycosyltransferase involved in LPS biosynthesis